MCMCMCLFCGECDGAKNSTRVCEYVMVLLVFPLHITPHKFIYCDLKPNVFIVENKTSVSKL